MTGKPVMFASNGERLEDFDVFHPERMASRTHCEIEQRQDKFFLTDRSANGTYLSIDGSSEIVLRREESMLRGHGCITLGQPRATAIASMPGQRVTPSPTVPVTSTAASTSTLGCDASWSATSRQP